MKATILSTAQMRADSGKEYNESVWNQNIDRMLKFKDVTFFKVEKGNGFDYDQYFVHYQLPEGLKLLSSFSYSSSLTSGGFQMAVISTFSITWDESGKPTVIQFKENEVEITGQNFNGEWLNNTKEAREFMIDKSKRFGTVYTKEGLY
jgi:hypothetical protein